jgi:hypothetical protein
MKEQLEVKDDKIVSINNRTNPMVSIIGKSDKDDQKFAAVIDLGDIDKSRTSGADAAYRYLNGQPGEFKVMTTSPLNPIKVVVYTVSIFTMGGLATWFALGI